LGLYFKYRILVYSGFGLDRFSSINNKIGIRKLTKLRIGIHIVI
jgi:hypothetical protein